jgi:DNA-binding LytR/AlgR family response regulator
MKVSCIIVEDTEDDLEVLQSYIGDVQQLSLLAHFNSVVDAKAYLSENAVDLIFCDIMIGDADGLSFIRSLENCPQVIFTTSFPNFALTGFELDATDYLVKPYLFKRFNQAVNKALAKHESHGRKEALETGKPADTETHFFIRSEHNIIKINYIDVIYVEGLKDYVKIVTPLKTYLSAIHLKIMEDQLPADMFIRVHRSFMVNVQKIDSLNNFEIVVEGNTLPLGESYRDNFLKKIVNKKIIKK